MTSVWLVGTFLLINVVAFTSPSKFKDEDTSDQIMPLDRTPEIVRRLKGAIVTLKCPISHCNHHRNHFKWEIKYCKPDIRSTSCGQSYHSYTNVENTSKSEWKRVSSKQTQTISCHEDEKISNLKVKIEHNVLYRCVVNNQTVRIYQLEVIELEKMDDGIPRILEMSPGDVTVPINSQLILQCKVYSSMQPLQIFWFKQCDGCVDHVVYNSTYYTKINTSADTSAVQKEVNVYVSKLNIYKVGLMDNGVYACVGVNGNSFNVKTAIVKIQGFDNWEPHASFSLLFLIPLAFALVPITVWLCYYRNKQKHLDRTIFQQRKKFIKRNNVQVPVV